MFPRRRKQEEQGVEPWTVEPLQEEPTGAPKGEPDSAAPKPSEVNVLEAGAPLSRAVDDLDSPIGKEQLDTRARISEMEERIGRLEHLVDRLGAEEDAALSPSNAGEAASKQARATGRPTRARRPKRVKRERVKRERIKRRHGLGGPGEQTEEAPRPRLIRRPAWTTAAPRRGSGRHPRGRTRPIRRIEATSR
jgi:hypothetical protein